MDDVYEQEKRARRIAFFSKKRLTRRRRRTIFIDVCGTYLFKKKHSSKRWRKILQEFYFFLKRRRWGERDSLTLGESVLRKRFALGNKWEISEFEQNAYQKSIFFNYCTKYITTLALLNNFIAQPDQTAVFRFGSWRHARKRQEYRRRVYLRLGFYNRRLASLDLYKGGSSNYTKGRRFDVIGLVEEQQRALQHFFQFRTLSQFSLFARTYFLRCKPGSLGSEGVLLALIHKVGLTADTRSSYLLVRAGGFFVNGHRVFNPHKVLSVGDAFRASPSILRSLQQYLLWRLQQKKGLIMGPPAYFFSDYKLLYFGIIRAPYSFEMLTPQHQPFVHLAKTFYAGKQLGERRWLG